ncbi:MAG: helix-turn-helix transcriptional regulator [Deltaproteobacteria bacterium]|jgi:DNA-binding CsgD family transcriptional regulator|nr:helix-turn-helix transcriptional regulator [Deltaproteobacteria bacterium]MDZ4082283.1 helix-turn-helix transcriptional regulator [Bdellovibrionales bacterium]
MLRDVLIQKGLSNREAEVAELVSKGLSNKEVANQLFVTEKTVKFHLTNIYKKMSVKSRAQLIVWCLPHLGFVDNEPAQPTRNEIPAGASAINTMPVGNTTVSGLTAGSATAAPMRTEIPSGGTGVGSGGNGDVGAFGI